MNTRSSTRLLNRQMRIIILFCLLLAICACASPPAIDEIETPQQNEGISESIDEEIVVPPDTLIIEEPMHESASEGEAVEVLIEPVPPITGKMQVVGEPVLNNIFSMRVVFTATIDAPDALFEPYFPPEVELIEPVFPFTVELRINEPFMFDVTARVIEDGIHDLFIFATVFEEGALGSGAAGRTVWVEGDDYWVGNRHELRPRNHWDTPRLGLSAHQLDRDLIDTNVTLLRSGSDGDLEKMLPDQGWHKLVPGELITAVIRVTPRVDLNRASVFLRAPIVAEQEGIEKQVYPATMEIEAGELSAAEADRLETDLKFDTKHYPQDDVNWWYGIMHAGQTYTFRFEFKAPEVSGWGGIGVGVFEMGVVNDSAQEIIRRRDGASVYIGYRLWEGELYQDVLGDGGQ